jgi:RNA-directed DNA polymerase
MNRARKLFDAILERDNLRLAVARALRGKRGRADARAYVAALESNLDALAAGLRAGDYPLGRARQFVIRDPKERIITAPAFDERVLHHAAMNVCEPHFERWLVPDTFACRAGKGRDPPLLPFGSGCSDELLVVRLSVLRNRADPVLAMPELVR